MMDNLIQTIANSLPLLIAMGYISPIIGMIIIPIFLMLINKYDIKNILDYNKKISLDLHSEQDRSDNSSYIYVIWYICKNYNLNNIKYVCERTESHNYKKTNNNAMCMPIFKILSSSPTKIIYKNNIILVEFYNSIKDYKIIFTVKLSGDDIKVIEDFIKFTALEYAEYTGKINKELKSYYYNLKWVPRTIYSNKSIDNVFLDKTSHKEIFNKIDIFKKSSEFYINSGIPYKKGFLFHGIPGCGKTTTIYAISNYLKYNIYKLNLNSFGDSKKFIEAVSDIPSHSVIVVEDIDTMNITGKRKIQKIKMKIEEFNELDYSHKDTIVIAAEMLHGVDTYVYPKSQEELDYLLDILNNNTDALNLYRDRGIEFDKYITETNATSYDPKKLCLSDLLEVFDGNEYFHGCIIIFTTNYPDKLDPALVRSGRIDAHINFLPVKIDIVINIIKYFYKDISDDLLNKMPKNIIINQSKLINTIILPNIDNCEKVIDILISQEIKLT